MRTHNMEEKVIVSDLTVRVSYTVGLGNVTMPEEVADQLRQVADSGYDLDDTSLSYPEAAEWLRDNIRQGDSMECNFNIDEFEL